MNMHVVPTVKRAPALTITPIDGEARILDTVLATHLGYEAPRQVRELIKRNLEELESFGGVVQRDTLVSGNKVAAYYLNRQQALLICILSKTEKAKEVRAEVIRRFDAYEELTRPAPAPVPAIPQTFAEALLLAHQQAVLIEKQDKVINFLTVDAYRAQPALRAYSEDTGWDHGLKTQLGKVSSRLCRERGVEIGSEKRRIRTAQGMTEKTVGVYPRHILDEAFDLLAPQYLTNSSDQ